MGALIWAGLLLVGIYCVANAPHNFARAEARLAQSAERKALNLVVVGSSPTVGVGVCFTV